MKYIFALVVGALFGVALFAISVAYNPFIGKLGLSPLAITDSPTVTFNYSSLAQDSIVYTNDGESRVEPYPEKVLQLWEQSIRQTAVMATVLLDGRNQPVGIGIKISSASEKTELHSGRALVDSVWYVYLPGKGALFVEQTENYWGYLRDVVLPAYRSSTKTWKGAWNGNMTSGPGALGTAKVSGGTGEFSGMEMLGVESLSVRAWRVDDGPVAAQGQLLIELPATALAEEN